MAQPKEEKKRQRNAADGKLYLSIRNWVYTMEEWDYNAIRYFKHGTRLCSTAQFVVFVS